MLLRIVVTIALAAACGVGRAGEPSSKFIHMGMLPTMFRSGKPAAFAAFKVPFVSVVEAQTGLTSNVALLAKLDDLRQQLSDGTLQLGLCHGFEFAWMKAKDANLRPLMIAAPAHRPLKAFVIVAATSPAKVLGDLRGKALALPNGLHETARLFADRQCHCQAAGPAQFFQQITTPVNAETALHDVYEDKVQAAIVDGAGMQCFAERYPARFRRIRVLVESPQFPLSVVAIRQGAMDSDMVRRFQDGMSKAHTTIVGRQLMGLMHSAGFEAVPSDYDQQLTEILKLYPPPDDGH